jgi:CubicO group peptidase (beta-lactamase class C family)
MMTNRTLLVGVMLLSRTLAAQGYPHASEPIGTVRQIYDGVLPFDVAVKTFRNIDRLFPTRVVPASNRPMPLPADPAPFPQIRIADRDSQYALERYCELNRVTGLLILKDGRIRYERYLHGNTAATRWMSMSVAKSITSTLIGAAIHEGKLSLTDPVTKHVPALAGSAYDGVTVRDVLMMASGVQWNETYTNPASDRRRLLEAQISQRPGSALEVMRSLPRAAEPGTKNNYNTGETQVAGEILRHAVGKPAATYLAERVWGKVGMESDANWWLDSPDGVEIGGSGFSATLRDYARFGQFILNDGVANGERILPEGWVREATSGKTLKGGAPLDFYGYLWWPGTSESDRRDRAFAADGIYGQHVYINPAARVVIVQWSAQAKPVGANVVDEWKLFEAVVNALP